MTILNSTAKDIDEIFRLYQLATNYQKAKNSVSWPDFERSLVKTEINESRQWKISINNKIACVWAITFSDSQIWEDKNNDPAIYIHRIATNPNFRGENFIEKIVAWAKEYAKSRHKKFVRMDTVGENKKLISYYKKNGFEFLGLFKLKNTDKLPAHYNNATVSLFELEL